MYKTLLEYCDEAESKALLGNTLTTQTTDTGTQALGTVHKSAEESINQMDRQFVLDVLNYDFTDLLLTLGIDVRGGSFEFEQPKQIDLAESINIDRTLQAMGLPMDDDYLYRKYGVERPRDYEQQKARMASTRTTEVVEGAGSVPQNRRAHGFGSRLRDFFASAPESTGADLEW